MLKLVCGCGRKFPFNPDKHQHDTFIYCPNCKTPIKNPSKTHFELPKFKLNWLTEKINQVRKKREAKKFLDSYFKVTRINQKTGQYEEKYLFPLNKWMTGQRPTVTQEQVMKAVGFKATQIMMIQEAERLEKLGVRIKG